MNRGDPSPDSWLAAQRWRLRVARRDGARLLRGLGRALRAAVAPSAPRPSIALLEGAAAARIGVANGYRLRLCNPTERRWQLRLEVKGRREGDLVYDFTAVRDVTLAPGAVLEGCLVSGWRGDAAMSFEAPVAAAAVCVPEDIPGVRPRRWTVTATLADGEHPLESVEIGGVFV